MKPDWDALMKEFKGHATALVADVDCTAEGKDLCEKVGVRGYPTIKYGDPDDLQDYDGGRDAAALKKFAEENLKPMCSPANMDLCDDDKKKEIEGFQAMSADDLDAKIAEKKDLITSTEKKFEEDLKELQSTYERLQKDKDEGIAKVKAAGLGLMQAVQAHAKKAKEEL